MKEPVFEAFYNFKVSKSQEDLIVMISLTFNIPMEGNASLGAASLYLAHSDYF